MFVCFGSLQYTNNNQDIGIWEPMFKCISSKLEGMKFYNKSTTTVNWTGKQSYFPIYFAFYIVPTIQFMNLLQVWPYILICWFSIPDVSNANLPD